MSITGSNILTIGRQPSIRLLRRKSAPSFIGAYDSIDNIAALYSTRVALTTFFEAGGKPIRLRRDSDHDEAVPPVLGNGSLDQAWIDDFLNGANGYIVKWHDIAGNWIGDDDGTDGNDAVQADAAAQPKLVVSDGAVTLQFDGSDDYLNSGVVPTATTSAAARFANAGSNGAVLGANATNAQFILRPSYFGQSSYVWGDTPVTPSTAYTSGVIGLAGNQPYKNGVPDGSAISGTFSGTSQALYIGARNQFGGGTVLDYLSGNIYEVIIASATYTQQQMSDIYDIMTGA